MTIAAASGSDNFRRIGIATSGMEFADVRFADVK
jgi:hypothetical protein